MKSRGSIVNIVRYRNNDSHETIQCMTACVVSDYETLCGYAVDDEELEGVITVIERRRGRVTCAQCLAIIDAVLNG